MTLIDDDILPVGKKVWSVPSSTCNKGQDEERVLLLTSCQEGQYSCDNAECIDIVMRCDGVAQCADLSDEKNCRLVNFDPEKYLKGRTPPSETPTLPVEVSGQIWTILDIQEVEQLKNIQFELVLKWFDTRLQFYNLKDNATMNFLLYEEKQNIWVPKIIFQNTKSQLTTMNDEKSRLKVLKQQAGAYNTDGLVSEDIDIYEGSKNPLVMSRVYDIEFMCNFQMQWYPFDSQTCYMEFMLEEEMNSFVDLYPGAEKYLGPKELTQYFVKNSSIEPYQRMGKSGVRISVTPGRRLLGVFLTVYFPTILLNLIGHGTNFFKPFFFEAVVTVNLTCMLVLATMFISVSNNLPKTSYIKMMDVWLIFNLLLPFMEVVLHTYIDSLRDDDEREINHHGTAIKPEVEESNKKNTDIKQKITQVIPERSAKISLGDLVSRNEKTKKKSLRKHYANEEERRTKRNERKVKLCMRFALVYKPLAALAFMSLYWILGLKRAE